MPERASRSEATTSCALLPMEDTMPMPVTTTRLMDGSPLRHRLPVPAQAGNAGGRGYVLPSSAMAPRKRAGAERSSGCDGLLQHGGLLVDEETDLEVLRLEDELAVDLHVAVGDSEDQLAHDHALQVDVVAYF